MGSTDAADVTVCLLRQDGKASMLRYCLVTKPNTEKFKTATFFFSQIMLVSLGPGKPNFVESDFSGKLFRNLSFKIFVFFIFL